jgi:DNA-3-methyladenine glycosylase
MAQPEPAGGSELRRPTAAGLPEAGILRGGLPDAALPGGAARRAVETRRNGVGRGKAVARPARVAARSERPAAPIARASGAAERPPTVQTLSELALARRPAAPAGPVASTGPAGPASPERVPSRDFFETGALAVAPMLLGMLLVRADGRVARLVEVEAYMGQDDPGSHAYRGPTRRTATMFGPPGVMYVYFTYGMHWCANVVCSPEGTASAVLLRAAEPLRGLDVMRQSRWHGQRQQHDRDLCRGPARLCEAFGITGSDDGADLLACDGELWLVDDGASGHESVATSRRIGLSRGAELPWRFFVPGSAWVS